MRTPDSISFAFYVSMCFVVKYHAGAHAEKTELVSPSEISKNSCLNIYIHIIYVPSSPWDLRCPFRWEIWPFAYEPNVKRHHQAAKQPDETLQQKWKPGYCAQTLDWRLYPVRRRQDLLLWMSMNSNRTEQNAINYSASRCPACRFGYHHFKLSLIDSHRPSYQFYLCIVDSQSLCINAISVAQRTLHSATSAGGPHLKATEVSLAKSGSVMYFKSYSPKIEQQGISNRCIAQRQNLSSCPWPFSRLCATWKGWNCENTFAFKTCSVRK